MGSWPSVLWGIATSNWTKQVDGATKNAPDNVAFVKRLFNRDTCGNDTLYIQQGHAIATSKLSNSEMAAERKVLGYRRGQSIQGKTAVAQYHAAR